MTRAIQKQIERSRQAQAGSKRIEVVLAASSLKDLALIREEFECTQASAIRLSASLLSGKIRLERNPEGF